MYSYFNSMTVRRCIEQLRNVGSHTIYLNNGTKILLLEMRANKSDYIGTFKWNEDGSWRVMRRIYCCVYANGKTVGMNELQQKYWLYNPKEEDYQYFHEDDFLIPERAMNEFIRDNNGIDEYQTISCPYYMMVDTMALFSEMEKDW